MKKQTIVICVILFVLVSAGNCQVSNHPRISQFDLVEVWRTDTVLITPESVLYDEVRDVVYVSNVNKDPGKKDGNGYISRLSTSGKILDLKWIEGISAPKGLALISDTLYAADIDGLLIIDIKKGEVIGKVAIEGMKWINDIASHQDNSLYISDSRAYKIYKYSNGKLSEWLSEGLNSPNGLLVDGDRLLVSGGSMGLSSIDFKTKKLTVINDRIKAGDGISFASLPGYYFASDFFGEIYMINPDSTGISLLNTKEQKSNTADLTYIQGINLLIVPTFEKNCVVGYRLIEKK